MKSVSWTRHPTKATTHYPGGELAASVHPNQSDCASDVEVEVFDRAGKRIDRRGARDIEDGIGMATAVLASRP